MITAAQLRTENVKLLEKVSVLTLQHRSQKELLPNRTSARKPRLNERMRKAKLDLPKGTNIGLLNSGLRSCRLTKAPL